MTILTLLNQNYNNIIKISQILIYKNLTIKNNKKLYSINFYFEISEYPNPFSLDTFDFTI